LTIQSSKLNLGLREKIAVIIFGVTLAFTFILVWAIKKQSTEKIFKDQGVLLHELAFQAADKLDQRMYERYVDVINLTSNQIIKDSNSPLNLKRETLEGLQRYFEEYSWIGLTDLQGKVLASTHKILEGADVSKRPWFQTGIKSISVGDVHEALLLAKLLPNTTAEPLRFVDVSAPVTNEKGEITGVIGAHLSWQWAREIKSALFEKSAKNYDVDLYILSNKGEILLGDKNDDAKELVQELSSSNNQSILKTKKFLVGMEKTKGHKSYPGFGWSVITVQPLEKALAPANELGNKVTLLGLLFGITLSFLFLFLSRSIFEPFMILTKIAKKFSNGETGEWPILKNHEEASILSQSLFDLSKSVNEKNKELERFNTSLVSLVDERTHELKEAKIKAEAASEAKSRFLAQMSHEIRTPIHGIMGMGQVLIETKLDEDQKKYSQSILNASRNLLDIINDILDYSKIEAGKMTLEEADFDLQKLAEDIIQTMTYLLKNKNLQLKLNLTQLEHNYYLGDSIRLRQIMTNLVGNAIKFTNSGTVELKIKTLKNLETQKAHLRFEISDTGIGLSPDSIERLFTSFSQADKSITRKFGGTGLGLAISKELVNLMGGEIGVVSDLGNGSTFWFEIELTHKVQGIKTVVQPSQQILFKEDARILIVDDDHDNRIIAIKALEKIAGTIDIAENGLIAIEKLKASHYDLVLMDCRMPEMDGFVATRTIRASESEFKNITIIAMTADATKDEEDACLKAGMDGFVSKPIEFKRLRKIVSSYLGN
jgi:signal transduction histidine kinase